MKYNIRMNSSELWESILFLIKKNTKMQKTVLDSVFLLLLLVYMNAGMRPEAAGVFRILQLPIALCLPWLFKIFIAYRNNKVYIKNDVEMKLENGTLSLTSKNKVLYPIEKITGNFLTKKILLLEYCPVNGIRTFFPIPRRIFNGRKEEAAFLQELDRQKREMENRQNEPDTDSMDSAGYAPDQKPVIPAGRKQGYCFAGPTQPEELAHMLAAIQTADRFLNRPKNWIMFLLCLLGAAALGVVLFGIKGGSICMAFTIIILLLRANAKTQDSYFKTMKRDADNGKQPGLYQSIQILSDKIICYDGRHTCIYSYYRWNILLQVEDVYIFCRKKGVSYVAVINSFFGDQEEEKQFLRFCEQQGVKRMTCPLKIRRKNYTRLLCICACIIILLMASVITDNRAAGREEPYVASNDENINDVFHPEDYPDYVPLLRQKEVLEELGFTVPDITVVELQQAMLEYDYAKVYIEGEPYREMLSILGYPEYDKETWKVISFPEQTYWLDWEGFNLFGDYENILEGVAALSQGEVSFTNIQINTDKVNWENGTGVLLVSLTCNGNAYDFQLEVNGDWLDASIISQMNKILEAEKLTNRVRCCSDNGQGAILFYCDSSWASEFEKKTGIHLG